MGFVQELKYLRGALSTLRRTTPIAKNPKRIFPWVVEELAKQYGDKEALELVRSYYSIPEAQRRRLFDLARVLSEVA